MNKTISVIVPVYNVAAYLPQCLDSILNQDYRELEVLLIDDGSTDASGAICDAYAAQDARIRVIHQPNGGAAAAKNAGLRAAAGTYLSFVDSDDFLEPNVYGWLVRTLEENGVDAVQAAFRDVYRSRTEEQHFWQGRQLMTGPEYLTVYPKDWSCPLLWNKLYKRALFDGVFFEEGHKVDDEYFTYQGFLKPCRVLREDRIIYNYRKRASGVMASPASAERLILDNLDFMVKRREKVTAVYPQLKRLYDGCYLDALWYLTENEGATERTVAEIRQRLRRYFRTPGHSFPPRYLWKNLLYTWRTDTQTHLQVAQANRQQIDTTDYFA